MFLELAATQTEFVMADVWRKIEICRTEAVPIPILRAQIVGERFSCSSFFATTSLKYGDWRGCAETTIVEYKTDFVLQSRHVVYYYQTPDYYPTNTINIGNIFLFFPSLPSCSIDPRK